jgi:uncharacterized protein YcbK (DUF882 family)
VADVQTITNDNWTEKPFTSRPLSELIPEEQWQEKKKLEEDSQKQKDVEEQKKLLEQHAEDERKKEEQLKLEAQQAQKKQLTLDTETSEEHSQEPEMPHPYIQRQLQEIRKLLAEMTDNKLLDIDSRLASIEQVVTDRSSKSRPTSRTKKLK